MSRPGLIPHRLKSRFHNAKSCIDVRSGAVHAIKANLYNRIWHNEVGLESASISVNKRTPRANNLVRKSKEPFHLLSYDTGADTRYWGRYICVGGTDTFELKTYHFTPIKHLYGSLKRVPVKYFFAVSKI